MPQLQVLQPCDQGEDRKKSCERETVSELDTLTELWADPDVTFCTVLFETLTARLLFTCLSEEVTATLLAVICVLPFAFALAASCTFDAACDLLVADCAGEPFASDAPACAASDGDAGTG